MDCVTNSIKEDTFLNEGGNMSKISIEYSSCWNSSREEKMVITDHDISYSIKWDELRLEQQGLFDLSWRRMPLDLLLRDTIHKIAAIMSEYDPDCDSREVCDGDITTITIDVDGKKSTWNFPLCAYDEIKEEMREVIKPLLPLELPLPEFLHSYLDDIEEAEEQ